MNHGCYQEEADCQSQTQIASENDPDEIACAARQTGHPQHERGNVIGELKAGRVIMGNQYNYTAPVASPQAFVAELQKLQAQQLRTQLLNRQRSAHAHLRARIGAGLALGELGHPDLRRQKFEFEGRTVWAITPLMQPLPAGEFIRGSDPNDKRAFKDEFTTERRISLPAFGIGRYPVTNAEYCLFVEDGGYANDRWWSDEGLKWKAGGPDAHDTAIEDWMKYRDLLKRTPDFEAQHQREPHPRHHIGRLVSQRYFTVWAA